MAEAVVKFRGDTRDLDNKISNINNSLGNLAKAAAAAFGGREIIQNINAYQQLQNRLKLVTKNSSELATAQAKLFKVAQQTRQGFEPTVELYQKLALNAANLNLSQEQLTKVTETVNKSIALSGAAGAQAEAGILQLSQAFASGRLSGDEFRSISENIPDILSRIAIATGKPRGELKKLAAEGKLTGKVVADSLLATADITDQAFGKLDITLAQSFTSFKNNLLSSLGALDSATGASKTLGRIIVALGQNLDTAAVALGSFIAVMAVGKIISFTKALKGATIAQKLLNLAMKANPFVLLASAIVGTITYVYNLLKPLKELELSLSTKIKYALQSMANAFLNTFEALGNVVFEFGKVLLAAINPFDDVDVGDAFSNFGSRMKEAFQSAYQDNPIQLLSAEEQAMIDAELKKIEDAKKAATGSVGGADIVTSAGAGSVVLDGEGGLSKEATALQNALYGIQKTGGDALTRLRIEQSQQRIKLEKYDNKVFEELGKDKNTVLAELEQNYRDKVAKMNLTDIQVAQQTRDALIAIETEKHNLGITSLEEFEKAKKNIQDNYRMAEIDAELNVFRQKQALIDKEFEYRKQKIAQQLMLEKGLFGEQAFNQEEAEKIAEERAKNEKAYEENKTKFLMDQGVKAFEAFSTQSKKAFEAYKALKIAQTIMDTYSGARAAFFSLAGIPVIGPALGAVAAAAAVAAGMAQVQQIRSLSYSGRRLGGPVMGNESYLVGENGPEVFTPTTNGSITRNQDIGKGGDVNVNFTIVANDTSGFDELLTSRQGVIKQIISDAMLERGQRSMV